MAKSGIMPWIDYQYTPKRKDYLLESVELMRQYLELMKPLFVVSFERKTSKIVRGNFVGRYNAKDLWPTVGVPEIHYWTDPGEILNIGMALQQVPRLTQADFPQATEERKLPTCQRMRNASSTYHCFIQAPTSIPLKIASGAG